MDVSSQLSHFALQLLDHPIECGFAVGLRPETSQSSHAFPFSRTTSSRVRFSLRRPTWPGFSLR